MVVLPKVGEVYVRRDLNSVRIEVSEGNIFADGKGRIAAHAVAVRENDLRYLNVK